jgi:phage terminase large subunit GpA-like protein
MTDAAVDVTALLTAESLAAFRATYRLALRPPPVLTVSEWADQFRMLAGKAASEPGPWRTSRTPYLRAIMDALSPRSRTEMVVVQKGSQVGLTEAANNWIGYLIDRCPAGILAVCPTEMLAHRWSKQRIMPLVQETPCLRDKVQPARKRDSGNTILLKEFPGGTLALAGANSAVSLRSIAARFVVLDEVDGYPAQVGHEGDPIELAQRASRTFQHRRKILVISTPLRAGTSQVAQAFEDCEAAYDYHVPCPRCGVFQALDWARMHWTLPEGFSLREGKQGRLRAIPGVTYTCSGCEAAIPEHAKAAMLPAGKWVPRWEHGDRSVGFFLSALYSPLGWLSWGEAAAMFERSERMPEKRQVFVNTILGLPYEEPSEAPDWERLYARRESYRRGVVPAGVRFLTVGVDIQGDRIEAEVVGWGREKRSWSVEYLVLPCEPSQEDRRRVLNDLLATEWPCVGGGSLAVWCLAVDSGDFTADVYAWARGKLPPAYGGAGIAVRQPRTVMVCKGFDRWGTPLMTPRKASAEERKRGLKVVGVGVSGLKRELYQWLRLRPVTPEERAAEIDDPYGFVHFPDYDEEWFRQLTAEKLVRSRTRQGFEREEWVKTRARNEALDCRILARAAAIAVGLDRLTGRDWVRIEAGLPAGVLATPSSPPAPAAPAAEPWATAPAFSTAPPPLSRAPRRVMRYRFGAFS